jgi:hypothetical protein
MDRIRKEKNTVDFMIRHYCKKFHKENYLCTSCTGLIDYARLKLDYCRYGDKKMSCTKCETHCYQKEQRDRIRVIMRYVGPRMIFLKPIDAILHKRFAWL